MDLQSAVIDVLLWEGHHFLKGQKKFLTNRVEGCWFLCHTTTGFSEMATSETRESTYFSETLTEIMLMTCISKNYIESK